MTRTSGAGDRAEDSAALGDDAVAFGHNAFSFRPVRPDHGGRLELKLATASNVSARYTLTIFTPDSERLAHVDVDAESGVLSVGDWQGGAPPQWLLLLANALLRTVWRHKSSVGSWPRRVTRWRAEKD